MGQEWHCTSTPRQEKPLHSALSLPSASSTQETALHIQQQGQCSRTPGSSPEFLLRVCKDILLSLGRGPMASPTRSHHLICTGCLVLLREAMPEVRHTWKAEFSPCSPSLPSAHSPPPHQQEQSSIHPREIQLQPSETLGYCNCYPCARWFKTPGWGPEGNTMLASSL